MADTKTEKTVADELRQAAATLRETARGVTPGPWDRAADVLDRDTPYGDNHVGFWRGEYLMSVAEAGAGEQADRDAAWICLASPVLAEPLAAWLEHTATVVVSFELPDHADHEPCADPLCYTAHPALAVARVLNGGGSREGRGSAGTGMPL